MDSLFGEGSATESGGDEEASEGGASTGSDKELSQTEIIRNAQEAFENAQQAQQDGDWAKYGEYLNELDKYLNMLSK